MAGPRQINVVSVMFYLLLAAGIYATVQYAPIFWKKTQLESLIKEHSYSARTKPVDAFRRALVDDALAKLSIALDPDEILVDKVEDRVRVEVTWHVTVDHPMGKVTHHAFHIARETMFY